MKSIQHRALDWQCKVGKAGKICQRAKLRQVDENALGKAHCSAVARQERVLVLETLNFQLFCAFISRRLTNESDSRAFLLLILLLVVLIRKESDWEYVGDSPGSNKPQGLQTVHLLDHSTILEVSFPRITDPITEQTKVSQS